MKKLYIYTFSAILSLMLIASGKMLAQTITVSGVPTTLCANEGFSLTYVASGFTPSIGNEYKVELSTAGGGYGGNYIASEFSVALSGTIYVTIPYDTPYGATYTLRVVATQPIQVFGAVSNIFNINCTTRDYYWIGGGGNWSELSHWEYTIDGGSTWVTNPAEPPRPEDNANFDNQSFPGGGVLYFDQYISINDFYMELGTGATNPVIESQWNTISLKGELVIDAGVLINFGSIEFSSTKQDLEINFGDNTLTNQNPGSLRFYQGGSWDLNSEMTASTIQISDGSTFSTNGYQVNLNGQIWANGSNNTLDTGDSDIYLSDLTSNGMAIIGNATWHFSHTSFSPQNISRDVTLDVVIIESGIYRLDGNNTFNTLEIKPGGGIIFSDLYSTNITTSFSAIGTRDQMVSIAAEVDGTPATLTIGAGATVVADFVTIQDNIITGSGTPYLADNSISIGANNSGWTFNTLTALDYFWIGGSGDWTDNSAHWGKLPGGGGFRDSPPGALDNVFFTATSFPSGGTITINTDATCNNMTWEAGSGASKPSMYGDFGNILTIKGDFILDDGLNRKVEQIFFESMAGETQNLDFADNLYDREYFTFLGGGTWNLQSDLKTYRINLNEGIFNSNDYQVDVERLNFYSGTSNWGNSIVNISSGIYNNDDLSVIFNKGTSTFNFEPKYASWIMRFNGPFVFYDVNIRGNAEINNNNYFNNLVFHPGAVVTLQSGFTQAIAGGSFSALGLRDQPIVIKSSSPGVQANISQGSGTVNTEYLIIEDISAGTTTFNTDYSTYNGTANSGGTVVSGWTFNGLLDPLTFYWVNGTGNWSDFANHWSQGDGDLINMYNFAPGPSDNVVFTSQSFTATGQVVTLDNSVEVNNMTWQANSGTNNPTITSDNQTELTIHGDLLMDDGVQRNLDDIIFDSPNSNNLFDLADNQGNASNGRLYFRGGGSWLQQGTIEAWEIRIEDALLNTESKEIRAGYIYLSEPSATINLFGSQVYLTGMSDWAGSGGFIANSSTIFITDEWGRFSGNFSFNNVVVKDLGNFNIENDMSVTNLTLEPGATLTIQDGQTLTTGSISAIGTSAKPIRIKSSQAGITSYLSQPSGAVNAQFLLISDNNAQTTVSATFSATNSIDAGNTGGLWLLTQPIPKNYFWVGGSGDWSDVAHWATANGGSTKHTTPPGIADDVSFTDLSFSGANQTVVIDQNAFCNNMTWTTTVAQSPTLFGTFDIPLKIFGSFILAEGVHRNVAELTFESYNFGNQLNFADNLKGSFARIKFRGTGEWSLLSDFEAQEVDFEGGTFDTKNFTLRIDEITFRGEDLNVFYANSSDIYTSRLDNNTWSNNLSFNRMASTVIIVETEQSSNSIYGPLNLNNLDIQADASLRNANSFSSLTVKDGVTLELSSNNTQIVGNLALNGLAGSPIILKSTNIGTQGTFSVPSTGSVTANYVIVQDNNATGGASFVATNSSEVSNVTGWTGLLPGQTISFPVMDDIIYNNPGFFPLMATSSSGLEVTYTVLPITGDGSITANSPGYIFNANAVGLVGIIADQVGNGSFGAAQSVTQYLHINQGDFPNELGQMKQASYVVGAPNGVSEGDWTPTDKSLPQVTQAISGPNGQLIAGGMGRVMIWNQLPDAYDVSADVVVGQADFTSFSESASRNTLAFPDDIFTGGVAIGPSGQLIVSDGRGVLIWNTIPTSNGAPADVIIGQTNFTSTAMAAAQDKFMTPLGVAVSTDGKLIVSDIAGHRVLVFNSIPTTNGAMADVVIGQPNFTSSTPGLSATNLAFPGYVTVTPDNKLLIADITNNRVLIYNSIPTSNGAAANAVLGQGDFNSNVAGTSASTLRFPMCAAVSRTGKVAIADWENNRVLIYNSLPADITTPPDMVLGQPDFTTSGFDYDNISLRSVATPFGVFWDQSENLLITDSGMDGLSRVMVYGAKDTEQPVITDYAVLQPNYTMGASNQVSTVTATDRSGIASAKAFWQEVNQQDPNGPSYEEAALVDLGNGQFQFDLSDIETRSPNPTGIIYYVELTDNAGNSVDNYATKQILPINYPSGTTLDKFGVGATSEDYRIMATPLELSNSAVENVFSDIYGGTYDKSKMRVYSYSGGTATTFTELSGSGNLLPGKGYFALAKTGSATSVTSPSGVTSFASTPATLPNEFVFEHRINLVQGWNMIGNPFLYTVNWSDIVALSGIASEVDQLQTYVGGSTGYGSISSIQKGQGAFVFATSAFELRIPAKVGTGGRIAGVTENRNPLAESSWEILFKAKITENEYVNLGGIGMEEDADFSKDPYDKMNAPAFGSMKSIVFNHPEYFYPSFSKDIRESAAEEKWQFEYTIEDADNSKHTLTWDNSYFGDNAPEIFLVDKTHFTTINMSEENSYTFNHGGITKFEVYYGTDAREALLPNQIEVQTPYPNPFTDRVSINIGLPQSDNEYKVIVAVYNTMGKQVATLTNAAMDSGYYTFDWLGTNDSGSEVPNGIYAYRVVIEGDLNNIISGKVVKK
ncbi:MAG: hypothetical protein DRI71_01775 [Bacteroidetes bacterium]|nr:MAG: hypothetical protein DRI71_01775 [Bacteroidota bacterium]